MCRMQCNPTGTCVDMKRNLPLRSGLLIPHFVIRARDSSVLQGRMTVGGLFVILSHLRLYNVGFLSATSSASLEARGWPRKCF